MHATVRIRAEDMATLRRLAEREGVPLAEALARAVNALRRELERGEEVAKMNAYADEFNAEASDVQDYAATW